MTGNAVVSRAVFDPYRDIDWGAPEFQVVADDPRWILPEVDPLGRRPWFRALPRDRRMAG